MQLHYQELYLAYSKARKGKSKKKDIIQRDINLDNNLKKLYHELITDTYTIQATTRYIIQDPVPREIIALSFRDRIVQHLVHGYIYPIRDRWFIYDSYSNRLGKWTLAAIQRASKFMRSCSNNYSQDCYILKADIQSFFVSVDRYILRNIISQKFRSLHVSRDKVWVLRLLQMIIFHNYTHKMEDRTTATQRLLIPSHKSLLFAPENNGMPLGNLTSQLFGNVYLHQLDLYIKHTLQIHYIRYVDDFIIFHPKKNYLLVCYQNIQTFLHDSLNITLHPRKKYIQYYTKWVRFLWVHIYPYCRIIWPRIKNWLIQALCKRKSNTSLMSYHGLIKHHNSWKYQKTLEEGKD